MASICRVDNNAPLPVKPAHQAGPFPTPHSHSPHFNPRVKGNFSQAESQQDYSPPYPQKKGEKGKKFKLFVVVCMLNVWHSSLVWKIKETAVLFQFRYFSSKEPPTKSDSCTWAPLLLGALLKNITMWIECNISTSLHLFIQMILQPSAPARPFAFVWFCVFFRFSLPLCMSWFSSRPPCHLKDKKKSQPRWDLIIQCHNKSCDQCFVLKKKIEKS